MVSVADIMTYLSNYIPHETTDIITYPCPTRANPC